MPVVNTKNLSDSAFSYLQARAGQRFDCGQIARYFDANERVMRKVLLSLAIGGKIVEVMAGRKRQFFVRNAASVQLEAHKPGPAWKIPAAMLERVRDLESHREQFPSHYAGAAN